MIVEVKYLKSPEIQPGSLVVFKSPDDPEFGGHPADREWQERAYNTYCKPLMVRVRLGDHVVLFDPRDPNKKNIHFGSTSDPRLHVGHVKLFP